MASALRYLGWVALAAAVLVLLAESFGWLSGEASTALFRPLVYAGGGTFALGLLLGMLSPVFRALRNGRCARCRARIERGQTYCADHLRETVQEYQDRLVG